jgi:hypothetical protein
VFLEAAASGVGVNIGTDGVAAFNPDVDVTTEFEVAVFDPCSLIKFSIIFGSFNILTSRSISIKPPCSLLFRMAATTSEAAAMSATEPEDTPAKGITQASEEMVQEEVGADIYLCKFCDCPLG